jgi:hypothetical protein
MSRVSLSGNALGTGTFTIASPNSNTDRTLTLPDISGTLLTNAPTQAASFGTLAVAGNNISAVNSMGFRNRIINGNMVIDQRNAGAVVTGESYIIDRWRVWRQQSYDIQQVTDAPTGFFNSLRVTKTSTTQSLYAYLVQYVEGFNFSDMLFGTANARTVTLSFWVKSSVTGTFSAGLANSAENRNYPATYTINAANTWEQKTITIAGDTSGTWIGNTSGRGVAVWFNFGATGTATANSWNADAIIPASSGSANLGTTNGATFFLTGVQLEAGSVATPFERRDIGRELMLCQRYYQRIDSGGNLNFPLVQMWWSGASGGLTGVRFSPTMRAAPTFSWSNVAAWSPVGGTVTVSSVTLAAATTSSCRLEATTATAPFTAGQTSFLHSNPDNGLGVLQFSAEL